MASSNPQWSLINLTADVVAAHVANNIVAISELSALIQSVYGTLSRLGQSEPAPSATQEPAVSVRSSIKPDYLICLEDGRKVKMLRPHLMRRFQMTPDEYRKKWKLPVDYPMVAPNYADRRRTLAKQMGLGVRGRGSR